MKIVFVAISPPMPPSVHPRHLERLTDGDQHLLLMAPPLLIVSLSVVPLLPTRITRHASTNPLWAPDAERARWREVHERRARRLCRG